MKKVFVIIILFLILPVLALTEDKTDINTASLEQLEELAGIGLVLGQRIINARPFSSVDDLDRVKGIGEKTLQKIKEQGLACVACATIKQGETRPPPNLKAQEVGSPVKTSAKTLPKAEKSDNNNIEPTDLTANLNQENIKSTSPWFLFFTTLTVALISAAAMLIIKLKLKPNN